MVIYEKFDFETARDYASKLVLISYAQRAGIFEALSEEKDIAALKHMLNADERALFIMLEALATLGYIHKKQGMYVISQKAWALFLERGDDYVGGSLPHFLNIMKAWLKLPEIVKGAKPDREERDVGAFMSRDVCREYAGKHGRWKHVHRRAIQGMAKRCRFSQDRNN